MDVHERPVHKTVGIRDTHVIETMDEDKSGYAKILKISCNTTRPSFP